MKEIYFQLNSLTVLMGISIAIIQYIFTNHQSTLKDILLNLGNIDFKKDNSVDNELEKKWEEVIRICKTHTYSISPNSLVAVGFVFIALISAVFIGILFGNVAYIDFGLILKILSVSFLIFLCAALYVMYQIFSKESTVKEEFQNIQKQHSMVEKVLASNKT